MNIICKNYDYTVTEFDDHVEVHNSSYDAKCSLLLLLLMLEFFSPDADIYNVPVTIIIPKNDSNNAADIVIDRKLRVHGTEDYEIIINKGEYDKWKKSYLITNILTIIIALILLAFAFIIVIGSDIPAALDILILALFACLPAVLIVKLYKQFKKADSIRMLNDTCKSN